MIKSVKRKEKREFFVIIQSIFHIQVILAIIVSWVISAIITAAGGFPEGSLARTDSRLDVLHKAEWIRVPYPGNLSRSFSSSL